MKTIIALCFLLLGCGAVAYVEYSPNMRTDVQAATGTNYVEMARQDAQQAGIDATIFVRQINQESGFQPRVVSRAGAIGIAQFMPATAAGLGIDPWNAVQSLQGAAQLMARYLHNYGGSYALALGAYNCGSGCIASARRRCSDFYWCVPAETQHYISVILQW